ncbi:hypothetical protein QO034_20460 [Sedimentitalea sp. JM2-8]|uniref:Uncharacterized protein n=1 Tax=Sedimentitalea xiamensis TaxID=3050037 RepID=A0ABT7FJZ0_9RHOB|nr:hypothetical protein [Sedimentitalea xiamensis]MDK3075452.1 hypothetical protein [Sedimentitalea xiamensis]
MAYPRATVKQSDLTKYFKAAQAAGYERPRVVIHPDGRVVIEAVEDEGTAGNPCDVLLK